MRRREFLTFLGGVAAWPVGAHAQQPTKVHRVGFISAIAPVADLVRNKGDNPFAQRLRALGYVEGTNLVLEWRSAEGRYERVPEIVRELISINIDVIVTHTSTMAQAAKDVTQSVPIVMATSTTPVERGIVQSLARPGGNITGLTIDTDLEIFAKRVQVLKELLPGMSRVAFLLPSTQRQRAEVQTVAAATNAVGAKLLLAEHTDTEHVNAFALIVREGPDALLVLHGAVNFAKRRLIVEFAANNRLPAMYPFPEAVKDGGLIADGSDNADLSRRAAGYVDNILKGAKPANLPIEQPTKFELVINLKTAKTLGITIPPTLLARADEVIE